MRLCHLSQRHVGVLGIGRLVKGLHDKFSAIGLAEIKFQFDQDPILTGYTSISQPSFSNNGSAGFFMKNDLKYIIRDDLTDSKDEYEAL